MKTIDMNNTLVDGYMRLLENLTSDNKLDLISRLTTSVERESNGRKSKFYQAFGAWDTTQSADEIIDELRTSRRFTRTLEEL